MFENGQSVILVNHPLATDDNLRWTIIDPDYRGLVELATDKPLEGPLVEIQRRGMILLVSPEQIRPAAELTED